MLFRSSDAEVDAKFRDLFAGTGNAAQCDAALAALWKFERAGNVADVLAQLALRSDCEA